MLASETDPNPLQALTSALTETTAVHLILDPRRRAVAMLESLAELGYVVQPGPALQAQIDRERHNTHAPGDCLVMDCPPDLDADGYGWPDVHGDRPASVALEAHAAVYGPREDDYGHPREDFTRTAMLWTGLLQHKLAEGAYVEAEDIARCMIAVKLSRDCHMPKRDNRVDGAGYFITLDRLETGR